MKKVNTCKVDNCIPTPSSCTEWNGGDVDYLGICDGEPLNNLLWEIINKLQAIAGEDLSSFDMDGLISICNTKAPNEVTLLNILNLVRENQVCLKDYTTQLSADIAALTNEDKVTIDLKCYQQFDNIGNALNISRNELDQLVINELCNNSNGITSLSGKIIELEASLNDLRNNPSQLDEQTTATCINPAVLPVSSQLINTSQALCDLQNASGNPADIQTAMSKIPSSWNTDFGSLPGWNNAPANEAHTIGNLLLVVQNLTLRISAMESGCCSINCDDIKVGYTAIINATNDGIIIKFNWGSGTNIPAGITDKGSSGTITDVYGNVENFNPVIVNNAEIDVPLNGLSLDSDLTIEIAAVLGNATLTCAKALGRTLKINNGCATCEIAAVGDDVSDVTIIYESDTVAVPVSSITG